MSNYKIVAETGYYNIGPIGFNSYARDFLKAYNSYDSDKRFSPASNYLVCRSIELSIKSFLCLKGMNVKKIRSKYGHNLTKALARAIRDGILNFLSISDEEISEVDRANMWYCRKGFEYFDVQNIADGPNSLPDLEILKGLAERMVESLKEHCIKAA